MPFTELSLGLGDECLQVRDLMPLLLIASCSQGPVQKSLTPLDLFQTICATTCYV